jgi:hypothetical protein
MASAMLMIVENEWASAPSAPEGVFPEGTPRPARFEGLP